MDKDKEKLIAKAKKFNDKLTRAAKSGKMKELLDKLAKGEKLINKD